MLRKFIFLIFFTASFSLFAIDDRNNDFQLWLTAATKKEINRCLAVKIAASDRRDKNGSRSYYKFGQIGIDWKIFPSLTVTPSYRQAYRKLINADKKTWYKPDAVPFIDITKKFTIKGFDLSLPSRFQYNSLSRSWLLREKIQVTLPFKFPIYLSNEFFFRKFKRYTQNRFSVGVMTYSYKEIDLDIGYILRSKESNTRWINQHILALGIKKNF